MIIYQEFLALNEEMASFNPTERFRFAVHEIMMKLKADEFILFADMSKILQEKYKINISAEILKKIFESWDRYNDPDYTVFKKSDKDWMDAWPYQNKVKRKLKDKQNFGKHRTKTTTTYSTTSDYNRAYHGRGRNYSPDDNFTKKNNDNRWGWGYNEYAD